MTKELADIIVSLLQLRGYQAYLMLRNSTPPRYVVSYELNDGLEHTIHCNTKIDELEFLIK